MKRSRSKGGLAGPDGMKSVFGQVCAKMSTFGTDSLMLPHRVWKVKFIGEMCVIILLFSEREKRAEQPGLYGYFFGQSSSKDFF